ncbi:MAG: hypothetical protein JSS02_08890, partial [Planctomycetes bacterium]|nr:hypothetical protein [Planctomycetota bacterium]
SRGGTLLNGTRIIASAELHDGDRVRLANVILTAEYSDLSLIIEEHRGITYIGVRPGLFDLIDANSETNPLHDESLHELECRRPIPPTHTILDVTRSGFLHTHAALLVSAMIQTLRHPDHCLTLVGAQEFAALWRSQHPDFPTVFNSVGEAADHIRKS